MTHEQALELAISTWPEDITPVVHYSSSRKLNEDSSVKAQAHADMIHERVNAFGHDIDIMFECKKKEVAVLQYRNKERILV
jgi:UV DNA damage repair endonuclease